MFVKDEVAEQKRLKKEENLSKWKKTTGGTENPQPSELGPGPSDEPTPNAQFKFSNPNKSADLLNRFKVQAGNGEAPTKPIEEPQPVQQNQVDPTPIKFSSRLKIDNTLHISEAEKELLEQKRREYAQMEGEDEKPGLSEKVLAAREKWGATKERNLPQKSNENLNGKSNGDLHPVEKGFKAVEPKGEVKREFAPLKTAPSLGPVNVVVPKTLAKKWD